MRPSQSPSKTRMTWVCEQTEVQPPFSYSIREYGEGETQGVDHGGGKWEEAQGGGTSRPSLESNVNRTFGAGWSCKVEGFPPKPRVTANHGPTTIKRIHYHACNTRLVGAWHGRGLFHALFMLSLYVCLLRLTITLFWMLPISNFL